MGKNFYKHLCKHYQTYSLLANTLNAISLGGALGVGLLTDTMTIQWLIGSAILFAILFMVGKLLDQEIDDLDKVKGHICDEHICDSKK